MQPRTLSCDIDFDQAVSAPNVRPSWSNRLYLLEIFGQASYLMLQSHQGGILWAQPSLIFLRVACHGLDLHGLLQSILQIVNLLLGEGGSSQGKQSLDEPIPLTVRIDRVNEFPDRVLESPH